MTTGRINQIAISRLSILPKKTRQQSEQNESRTLSIPSTSFGVIYDNRILFECKQTALDLSTDMLL